jgi:hypothetical protein
MAIEELPGWHAVLRFENVDGIKRLLELRIIAGDIDAQVTKHESLTDSGLTLTEAGPDSELTTTMLRKIAIDRLARTARTGIHPEYAKLPRLEPFLFDRVRPGRRGRNNVEFAKLAQQYITEFNSGNPHPTKTLAKAHHLSPSQMSQLINQARNRGLLTRPPGKGRPGGELTEDAYTLLEKDRTQSNERGDFDVS